MTPPTFMIKSKQNLTFTSQNIPYCISKVQSFYRVYQKKGNPTLTRCSTKTIQCTCNLFHIRKDQSFTY